MFLQSDVFPVLFIDPPFCREVYGPDNIIPLLFNMTANDHAVCGSTQTEMDTLRFPPSVTKTYCLLETLIHSINNNRKASVNNNNNKQTNSRHLTLLTLCSCRPRLSPESSRTPGTEGISFPSQTQEERTHFYRSDWMLPTTHFCSLIKQTTTTSKPSPSHTLTPFCRTECGTNSF